MSLEQPGSKLVACLPYMFDQLESGSNFRTHWRKEMKPKHNNLYLKHGGPCNVCLVIMFSTIQFIAFYWVQWCSRPGAYCACKLATRLPWKTALGYCCKSFNVLLSIGVVTYPNAWNSLWLILQPGKWCYPYTLVFIAGSSHCCGVTMGTRWNYECHSLTIPTCRVHLFLSQVCFTFNCGICLERLKF